MKKFCFKIGIFLTLIYSVSLIIDIAISKNIQPNGELQSWHDLYSGNIDADLIIFGSSRTHYGFNTKIIEDSLNIKVYNLGLTNSRIQTTYLRLLEYLRVTKHKPKIVTLEIDFSSCENSNSISRHWQLFPYLLYNKNIFYLTHKMDGFKTEYYLIPLVRYSNYFTDLLNNNREGSSKRFYKGYYAIHTNFDHDWSPETDTIKKHVQIDNNKLELLSLFVKTCKDNNLKLNIIYTPEFYFVSKKVTNRDSIRDYIQHFAENNHIPFSDMSRPPFCSDTSYFWNLRHLNALGADKFTSEYYVPWIKELYGL